MKPVISQTKISQPALPVNCVMVELTMKIPDPIIDPATIIVPSSKPSVGLKWAVVLVVSAIGLNVHEKSENPQNPASLAGQNHRVAPYPLFGLLIIGIQPIHQVIGDIIEGILIVDDRIGVIVRDNISETLPPVVIFYEILNLLSDLIPLVF